MSRRFLFAIALTCGALFAGEDRDRDGIDDKLEKELLERFAPRFEISASECAGLPTEFQPGHDPVVRSENGTVYGQVSPGPRGGIEIRYFHLWSRDCGKLPHALDAEHVSALLYPEGDPRKAKSWRAAYWYAGAHEDTLCDASRGARARFLDDASERGPQVYISRGKHASHLSLESCARGCGGDQCLAPFTTLRPERIINFGEKDALLNGTEWLRSPAWAFEEKFVTDFPAWFLDDLDRSKGGLTAAAPMLMPAQTALGSTGSALGTGFRHTRGSLNKARRSVSSWLEKRLR